MAEAVRQRSQNGVLRPFFIAGTGPEENALRQLGAPSTRWVPCPTRRSSAVNAGQLLLPADPEYAEGFPTTL